MAFMDARAKRVYSQFVNRTSRGGRVLDAFTFLGPYRPQGSYELPEEPTPTEVAADTRAEPTRSDIEVTTLNFTKKPSFRRLLPDVDESLLEGNYMVSLANGWYSRMQNLVDNDLLAALLQASVEVGGKNAAYGDGGNVVNIDGDTALSSSQPAQVEGSLADFDGFERENFMYVPAPTPFGYLRSLEGSASFAERNALGVPFANVSLNSIPMRENSGLSSTYRVAVSASAVAGGDWSFTVAKGHGLQVGMFVTFATTSGSGQQITAFAAITGVTSGDTTDTIAVSSGSATAATNGAGALTLRGMPVILFDRSKAFFGGDIMPYVKMVDDSESVGEVLQIAQRYGRIALAGSVRLLLIEP